MLDFPVLDLHNFCVGIILLDGIGENWDAGRSQILEYSHSFLIAGMYGMPSCQDSISPGEEDYYLISYASCCPIKGTLVLNTWWWSVVDTAIKIDWAGWLQKQTTGEQSSPQRARWNCRIFPLLPAAWFTLRTGDFYECGSIYNCLLSQERSLGVWELQFVWDYLLPVELFYLVTKIFFLWFI